MVIVRRLIAALLRDERHGVESCPSSGFLLRDGVPQAIRWARPAVQTTGVPRKSTTLAARYRRQTQGFSKRHPKPIEQAISFMRP